MSGPAAESLRPENVSKIMARFWYSCALFCVAAFLLPFLPLEQGDSGGLQLGVTFFAVAVMAWTFIAAWFCYSSPLFERKDAEVLEVSRNVLSRVAQGFADFIVENSRREDKSGGEAVSSLRGLDFAKFEELVAVAPAAAASALYGYKSQSPKEILNAWGEGEAPQLDAPHLGLFKELLRDRLVANLMAEGEDQNWKAFGLTSVRGACGVEELQDVLRELLREEATTATKEDIPFAASMAEHARSIGDKCFREQQFVAAVHCYEVATLLCPSGPSCPSEQLASCHCNCATACLELQRYGDAISECHAALVLLPSLSMTMKVLQRLAAAHICLRNYCEASRCLQNCLDLDPGNTRLQGLLARVTAHESSVDRLHGSECLVWVDVGLPEVRDKRKRKGKKKGSDEPRHIDREASIWHSMVGHSSKLYIFGGLPSDALESQEGSEEFHIIDVETSEVFPSRSHVSHVQGCFGHSATVLENSMLIYGGSLEGVLVFDFLTATWRCPSCGRGPRRQGHSATAQTRQLLVFGGIELMEQQNGRVCNDCYLLDTGTWTWKKLDCAGTVPPARFGHTATMLPDSSNLLIVGGRDQMTSSRHLVHDHSGLHILDISKQTWSEQAFSGRCPEKAFGHFACIWNPNSLLLLSGEAERGKEAQVELFLLDLESWSWSQPTILGVPPPCARLGHAVAAVDERVYLFGGLCLRGEQTVVDKTIYMLEKDSKDKDCQIDSKEPKDGAKDVKDSAKEVKEKEEEEKEKEDKEKEKSEEDDPQETEEEEEPELSFEELLEQEKAFFKLQSKKASFPRSKEEAQAQVRRKGKKSKAQSGAQSGA